MKNIGRAEARGMVGIAFDFGRMTFVAFREQAGGKSAERHRGRKIKRFAGNQFFRLLDVGDNFFNRLARARGQPGERERTRP